MTPAIDYGLTSDVYDYAMGLIAKPSEKNMMLSNGKYALHLEIDEDTYWGLVKLGAEIRTDHETYAENVLVGLVEAELDKQATN
jgi:hypothetical protein